MPIRFACPSCQQPLEIDDPYAGQAVQCFYCRHVVQAPTTSTWEPGQSIPVASPARSAEPSARSAFEPPPPPRGMTPTGPTTRSASAGWALTLSLLAATVGILGFGAWIYDFSQVVYDKLGPTPTPEQISRLQQEMFQTGTVPTNSFSTLAMVIGVICGVAGFAMGIRAIIQQENRSLAIFACVVSLLCVVCQGMMTLMFLSIPLIRQQQAS